ncbi:MAG: hypothetical protein Q9227_001777 [Pyrenula ochraceoflavens]
MASQPPSWFSDLHSVPNLDRADVDDLRLLIRTFPCIDNHAHNLLSPENANGSPEYPLESIASEAQGAALTDHVSSTLSLIRAVKDLSELFGCAESWEEIKRVREERIQKDYDGFITKCFEGTHAILMDDGLNEEVVQPYQWHRKFVPRVSRIVRIEAIAADLLKQLITSSKNAESETPFEKNATEALFVRFNSEFRNQIRALANNPDVRGFKSVVCYRTGLNVDVSSKKMLRPRQSLTDSDLLTAFHEFVGEAAKSDNFRIAKKAFNDYLVVAVCEVLEKLWEAQLKKLPFQFHTGLGDTDIKLTHSSPAHMQALISAFPNVNFILLHSSYPYTKDAGYIASAYANAYMDIGEVFPMLSREGQENAIRETLELAPVSKVLWSTDGHFFPETYWLANRQFRVAFEQALVSGVSAGDYSVSQAIKIAVYIMFFNSNDLYGLGEDQRYPQLLTICGLGRPSSSASTNYSFPMRRKTTVNGNATPRGSVNSASDFLTFKGFLSAHPNVKYIWLQCIDYTTTIRGRMIPVSSFVSILRDGKYPSITSGLLRILQTDTIAEGGSATGQFQLQPDLTSLTLNAGMDAVSNSATCQSFWLRDGSSSVLEGCPRSTLRKYVDIARTDFGITFLMGFEIEVCFVRPVTDPSSGKNTSFEPLSNVHGWNALTTDQLTVLPMMEEIVEALSTVGIDLPMFHAEAAPGQWEFVLPPYEPLKSIDSLFKARQTITHVALKHGLKATVYPRPYNFTCGSASHAHFSIQPLQYDEPFLAGVLDHLPAILALSLPAEESYERVHGGIWAGGEWVAWGYQNKETPLRKIEPGHYELKTLDGLSNTYLAMAAVLAAGLDGVRNNRQLTFKDCPFDVSQISEQQRREYGISTRLPDTLEKAIKELQGDRLMVKALGREFVENYAAVKRGEMEFLGKMGEGERRVWMMERY